MASATITSTASQDSQQTGALVDFARTQTRFLQAYLLISCTVFRDYKVTGIRYCANRTRWKNTVKVGLGEHSGCCALHWPLVETTST